MKRISILLSVLFIFTVVCSAAFASSDTVDTEATVAFAEGDPEFGDTSLEADLNNMYISFGTHDLPVGGQTYTAADGNHTLRILDSSSNGNAGDWNVTVELSMFESQTDGVTNSFVGTIKMENATNNPLIGLTPVDPLEITSNGGEMPVVTADSGLNKGNYDTTWAQTDITLTIGDSAAGSIVEPASYMAELTWTLYFT